jgi:aryl-alcohol dehydrogenase-like predicted oxidoreductase
MLEGKVFARSLSTRADGLPWGALGGGNFKTKEQFKSEDRRTFWPQSDNQEKLSEVLEGIANKRGTIMTSVALAYVMHKTPYVFPICGCRKLSYLKANIEALGLKLTDEEIGEIEDAVPFDVGLNTMYGRFDWVSDTKAIPLGLHNKL